jgi:Uncharacterized protein conserved in bacteria (DUF2334)
MSDWLLPIRQVLDNSPQPVRIFFRDDDAGWANDRLYALLDVFATWQMPIDLAVIPDALEQTLADELLVRWRQSPGLLGLHQHGFSHQNHEPETARKCEFGQARNHAQQAADIIKGKVLIDSFFGLANDPIFTPPWNRCTQDTVQCLQDVGFEILSRDLSAPPFANNTLKAAPVSINWSRLIKDHNHPREEIAKNIANSIQNNPLTGIMFHHADMAVSHLNDLADLLSLLSSHQNAQSALIKATVH